MLRFDVEPVSSGFSTVKRAVRAEKIGSALRAELEEKREKREEKRKRREGEEWMRTKAAYRYVTSIAGTLTTIRSALRQPSPELKLRL